MCLESFLPECRIPSSGAQSVPNRVPPRPAANFPRQAGGHRAGRRGVGARVASSAGPDKIHFLQQRSLGNLPAGKIGSVAGVEATGHQPGQLSAQTAIHQPLQWAQREGIWPPGPSHHSQTAGREEPRVPFFGKGA